MKKLNHASSLVLVAGNNMIGSSLKTLALKRGSGSSHFPEAYVFPGGNSDTADQSKEWLTIIPKNECLVSLNLTGLKETIGSPVSMAISSRITAIRETFEECGILLCKRDTDKTSIKASHYEILDKKEWQEKVAEDAGEFLNLCRTHHCYPSVRSLYLLSNWITPKSISKRYDCKFFIAFLDREVETEIDDTEIQGAEWGSVNYFIGNENIFLPPPQFYEMSILNRFSNADYLCKLAVSNELRECEPFIPVYVNTKDGKIIFLPGDEKYAELFDENATEMIELKNNNISLRGETMHRIEYYDNIKSRQVRHVLIKNCYPKFHNLLNVSGISKM